RQVERIVIDCIDAEPFVLRAEARMSSNLSGALEDLDVALRFEPRQPNALALRALVLEKAGRTDEALESCRAALLTDPDRVLIYVAQARLLAERGQYEAAKAAVQLA